MRHHATNDAPTLFMVNKTHRHHHPTKPKRLLSTTTATKIPQQPSSTTRVTFDESKNQYYEENENVFLEDRLLMVYNLNEYESFCKECKYTVAQIKLRKREKYLAHQQQQQQQQQQQKMTTNETTSTTVTTTMEIDGEETVGELLTTTSAAPATCPSLSPSATTTAATASNNNDYYIPTNNLCSRGLEGFHERMCGKNRKEWRLFYTHYVVMYFRQMYRDHGYQYPDIGISLSAAKISVSHMERARGRARQDWKVACMIYSQHP